MRPCDAIHCCGAAVPDMPDLDLMGYMPDPVEYVQVIPIQRDNGIWFQVTDTVTGNAVLFDLITTMKLAGRLSYLAGRLLQDFGKAEYETMGPFEREGITRAMDDPTDEQWQRETYRRPKN